MSKHDGPRPDQTLMMSGDVLKAALSAARPAGPCAAVIFGASGDLTKRKLVPALPVRGGEAFLRRMFEPLGYEVTATRHPLDPAFPGWGESPYFSVTLRKTAALSELLTHLYVLIPVFDNQKHYYIGDDELEKLLAKGEGWLAAHPEKEEIARRYLRFQTSLYRQALARLVQEEEPAEDATDLAISF